MRPLGRLISLMLVTLGLARSSAADPPKLDRPRYYVLVFGSDAGPLRPTRTHTWATYVQATPGPNGSVKLEPVTISWLPSDGTVDGLRPFRPEPGRNYGLHETLRFVADQGQEVALWGPYEIDARRYEAAVRRAAAMRSGTVAYRAVDSIGPRQPEASHCVHAVTGADPVLASVTQPASRIGRAGTAQVVRQLIPAAGINPSVRHDWLIPALGLQRYPIERR